MSCKPRMAGCSASCLHRRLVLDYRAERHRQEIAAENASKGHRAELAEHLEKKPLITFKQYLTGTAVPTEVRHAA